MHHSSISVRIVWRGGEVSDLVVEQAVNGLQALSRGAEMEARLLDLRAKVSMTPRLPNC